MLKDAPLRGTPQHEGLLKHRGSRRMKDNVKRVFYVRYVAHPCYLDIIAQRPEIRLDKLENETANEVAEPIMAAPHAYQIRSSPAERSAALPSARQSHSRLSHHLVLSTHRD